jgi:hypothetical protein
MVIGEGRPQTRCAIIQAFSQAVIEEPAGATEPEVEDRCAVRPLLRPVSLAVLVCTLAAPAAADIRITSSPGGLIGPFLDLFDAVRQSGQRVIIDGPCYSACTLVLTVLPPEQICVTRRAVLGFHGAMSLTRRGNFRQEPEASKIVLAAYPPPVRRWIERHGGLHSKLLRLRGRELAAMYASCR